MEPNLLKYPKKSHRKIINLPAASSELAELMGIVFGDGGINNNWQLVISVNSNSDKDYSQYIVRLIEKLFSLKVTVTKRPGQNTLILVCSSTTLVDFLVTKGAVRGNKIKQKINVPKWILGNPEYEKAFVRGMVDTDGCLYIHRHIAKNKKCVNIGFCFTSRSRPLIKSISSIMKKNELNPHIGDNNQRIYLYGIESVLKYLTVFGSNNPRITNKYNQWRDARVV